MQRRDFLTGCATALGAMIGTTFVATRLQAQDAQPSNTPAPNNAAMDQEAYRQVRLPPKPGARPALTDAQRDDLEHHIHCQCGCGLDVYTCRTTDFSCSVSPAMHLDVLNLVAGGYTGDEIMAEFRSVYGERVLMSPAKEGFNWLAYLMPFGALAVGSVIVASLLKRWSKPTGAAPVTPVSHADATPDELARLRDVMRNDE